MANTLKFGNGEWYGKKDTILAYNSENNNYKPLPFSFDRDSSATRVNKEGLIETVGSGEPRIDYKDDSKGALLLEPSRSNLVKSSGDISTQSTYWLSNQGGTSIQNATTAPDGSNTASQINTFGQQYGGITQGSISVSNTEYTYSVYLKAKNGTPNIRLIFFDGVTFHSSDFTISSEWERYDYKFTPLAGSFQIYITCPYVETSFYTWGIQLEQGSYATSYIPTQGSIGTRVAETCSDAGNDQVINSTEGVLYFEGSSFIDSDFKSFSLSDGSVSNGDDNRVMIGFQNSILYVNVRVGNFYQFNENLTIPINNNNKIALKYKENDFAVWVNGNEIRSGNSGTTFSQGVLKKLQFADGRPTTSVFNGNCKDLRVYNKALSDAELQALTTI